MPGFISAAVKAEKPVDGVVELSKARRKYVEVALRLFVERGYAGTSIDDIAGALGVTKGAVYFHYKDKADLLHQCLAHADSLVLDPLIERITNMSARRGPRFDIYIYWWASLASVHPHELLLPILMSVEFANSDTETTRYLDARYDRIYALICESILPPIDEEDGGAELMRAKAMTLIATTDGMLIEWHRRGRTGNGALTAKTVRNTLRIGLGINQEKASARTRDAGLPAGTDDQR